MSEDKIKMYERAIAREKAARKQAEEILEEKSRELYLLTQELKTSNEKLEQLVSETTSELKGVFDNILDSYLVMDLSGNVLKMNDAAVDFFGYDIKKERLNVASLIYYEDIKYAMNSFAELTEKGFFTDYKARIYTKHKEVKWVHINASIIYNADNKPIAAQGIVRDITEAEKTAETIREQQFKLAAIVDYSSLGIILTQEGKIIQTNKAAQDLLQYTEEEFLQMQVKDVSLKEDYPESVHFMEQMNSNKIDHFIIKKRYLKKDRTTIWAKTNVAAVRLADKTIRYQVALIEDITESLKNEEDRNRLLVELEKSNDELEEYAHIVSHDLKSPLRSINALVNWIKEDNEGNLNQDTLENLGMIDITLEKMEQLISDVLEYASINNGDKKNEKVNINDVIDDIEKLLHFPEHIALTVKNKLPILHADRVRIQQLFQNLISNAIRYIDKEKGYIEIDVKEKNSYYEFSVKDNGIGIADEFHEKIFKIFQSLHKNKESTGIGLSIVKKIVDLYHGTIWLESTKGIGTTFYFTIKK
ncbi:PAS domain S-box protein [Dokdonia sp.]|uniref:PAS domain-containing sensor histidine kinase n=1 Tax=Dokdonia sp. TaxID=2024995 RepID=UPI0032644318